METNKSKRKIMILGGIAGISVGIFVLTFAFIGGAHDLAFVHGVSTGEPIDYFLRNILEHPQLSMFIVSSLAIGFGSMYVAGFCLYHLISTTYWQKYLAVAGYTIGIPVAIYNFLERLAFQNQLILLSEKKPDILNEIELHARLTFQEWEFTGNFVGPFFVVLIGTTFMAWAAFKDGLLPNWLCYWGMGCGIATVLFFGHYAFPMLAIASLGAGPLHMLWFFVTGVVLLRKSQKFK